MFAVVCIVVCIIVCVIEVQCVHRRVHHVRSLCALSCGPVILVHLVDGSSCNTYHQHAYVSPITPLGPRGPGALGPRDPGTQGPRVPGPRVPGPLGPWAPMLTLRRHLYTFTFIHDIYSQNPTFRRAVDRAPKGCGWLILLSCLVILSSLI